MKGSFFTPLDQIIGPDKKSIQLIMRDMGGIYVSWLTKPEVVKRILPPPMMAPAPIVLAYAINMGNTTFGPSYRESACAIPCVCNGITGVYWISFMLSGQGAEMGTFLGREAGIPKKIADNINIKRTGDHAKATVTRHGIDIFDVEVDINGQFNNVAAENVFGRGVVPGAEILLNSFLYKYDYRNEEDGIVHYGDVNVLNMAFATKYNSFEKATANVKLEDSVEDPWSELEVVEVLGGVWTNTDVNLAWTKILATLKPEDALPYLMSARYDKDPFKRS